MSLNYVYCSCPAVRACQGELTTYLYVLVLVYAAAQQYQLQGVSSKYVLVQKAYYLSGVLRNMMQPLFIFRINFQFLFQWFADAVAAATADVRNKDSMEAVVVAA